MINTRSAITFFIFILASMRQASAASVPQYISHKNCNNVPVGTLVAHPTNCSQYIRCNGLRSLLGDCPTDTYFNPRVLSCDKSKIACTAKETTLPTTATTFLPTSTTATLTESTLQSFSTSTPATSNGHETLGRPLCTPWLEQQYPHPYNCEYYYDCVRGYLTVRRCLYGFMWDLNRQSCVPRHEANCFTNSV